MKNIPQDKQIILFDGVCNFCNDWVNYIIQKDQRDVFRFVALQSEMGLGIQKRLGILDRKIDSIVLYIPNQAYFIKSDAVLEIAKSLPYLSWLRLFKIIPTSLRNPIYDYIAKNRYKWFGKKENCMLPTAEIRGKFL
ncbi:thiol-disulfide oxidoreductase DCC family protein [Flavobacterium sp.]|uniref:thiol-disulfide oxidoreductase DCC family protein n=1 Tax=Flavobacterium sp. TaxID=239 RepID=UPI003D100948